MLVVGLTGGIATGKSTVCGMLSEAGAVVIDADVIAREVVKPGLAAWSEIRDLFGPAVLNPDGSINRRKVGDIVFHDSRLRRKLEQIIHPRVNASIQARVEEVRRRRPEALVVLDVPLLFEAGMQHGLSEVILVYAPGEVQLRRLMERDGLTRRSALARIASQTPIEEKRRLATIIIDNSGTLAVTEEQVLRIYRDLAARASVQPT